MSTNKLRGIILEGIILLYAIVTTFELAPPMLSSTGTALPSGGSEGTTTLTW
jgi:hypothetical protein